MIIYSKLQIQKNCCLFYGRKLQKIAKNGQISPQNSQKSAYVLKFTIGTKLFSFTKVLSSTQRGIWKWKENSKELLSVIWFFWGRYLVRFFSKSKQNRNLIFHFRDKSTLVVSLETKHPRIYCRSLSVHVPSICRVEDLIIHSWLELKNK